jgi:hypothetical protein
MTMNKAPVFYARLSKDGLRATCGIFHCRGVVAHINVHARSGTRTLYFPDGFSPDDKGVWRLGRHAMREKPYKTRLRLYKYLKDDSHTFHSIDPVLPVLAKCPMPKCGRVLVLDAERLSVSLKAMGPPS